MQVYLRRAEDLHAGWGLLRPSLVSEAERLCMSDMQDAGWVGFATPEFGE